MEILSPRDAPEESGLEGADEDIVIEEFATLEENSRGMDFQNAPLLAKLEEVKEEDVLKSEVDVFYSEVLSAVSLGSNIEDLVDEVDDSSVAAVKMSRQTSTQEECQPADDEESNSVAAVSASAKTERVANLSGIVKAKNISASSVSSSSSTVEEMTGTEFSNLDYARLEHLAEPVIEARRVARLQRDQRRAQLLSRHHPNYEKHQNRTRLSFAGGTSQLKKYFPLKNVSKSQLVLIVIIFIFFAISVVTLVFIVLVVKDRDDSDSTLQAAANVPTTAPSVLPVEGSVAIPYMDPILASQMQKDIPTMSPVATGLLRGSTPPVPISCPELPSPPPFPGKKGVAISLGALNEEGSWIKNLPKLLRLNPHWNYNWNLKRLGAQPTDIEFVPMVGSGVFQSGELQESIAEYVLPHIENGNVKRLLTFNQPDRADQANLSVSQAIEIWPQLELIDLPLISPSCAEAESKWMDEFMKNTAHSCYRVDWVGVQWYGAPDFDNFTSVIAGLYETYERRHLVLTEFGIADWNATTVEEHRYTPGQVLDFMQLALPWLEQQDWIAGYVWFNFDLESPVGTSGALLDDEGQLTALGQYYASVRNDSPLGNQTITV